MTPKLRGACADLFGGFATEFGLTVGLGDVSKKPPPLE